MSLFKSGWIFSNQPKDVCLLKSTFDLIVSVKIKKRRAFHLEVINLPLLCLA